MFDFITFDFLTFVLCDYRCPHCRHSLRFRWVKTREIVPVPWERGMIATYHEVCPVCEGAIKVSWHLAVFHEWLWAKRLAPGIAIWIVAMLINFPPLMMAAGTVVLLVGLVAIVYYMVVDRWQRPYYNPFEVEKIQYKPGVNPE